jgi:putative phosphoribosyl transferase
MTDFADLADGGRRLVEPLREIAVSMDEARLVAIVPNGIPVAEPLADALDLPLVGAYLDREGEPRVVEIPQVAGRTAIVVDDGVETGTAATLVGVALRDAGASRLILAVPVCPRQADAALRLLYDDIIAIARPLARRDLRWHYADFDTIDEAEARRRLDAR